MQTKVIAIGNSRGIRIPKPILQQYAIDDDLEMELRDDGILLRPVNAVRKGWDAAFARMAAEGDDQLLIDDVFDDEPFEE